MVDDYLDYGKLIDEAMHDVVRKSLVLVEEHGLPLDHHFFITFLTRYPGVVISDELQERYPDEMTIVIQHQFWDLEIQQDYFSIVLSFDNVKQSLTIPFNALVSFADPSVKFGLQFQLEPIEPMIPDDPSHSNNVPALSNSKKSSNNNVVQLDSFRKKK